MSPVQPGPAGLKREIGLFGATALGIGAIIGSGIFIVTGIVAGMAGPAMIISVLVAGAIALFSALSVAELSAYLPEEGGTYVYAQKLISPFAGFIAGWIWVFSNIFVGAAVSLGFAHYFATLFPALPVKGIAVIICLIFITINYIGLKESTILNNLLVTFKVLILLFFIAFGLGFFSTTNLSPFAPSGISGILGGAALIFFAYTGFARVTIMAEEVKDPRVTIPRSIYLALAISTVLYIFVSIIAVGLVGAPALSQSGSPLTDAIRVTGSSPAILLVSIGAMIATASVLLTTIMGISRIDLCQYNCRGTCRCTGALGVRISPRRCNQGYWQFSCNTSRINRGNDRDGKCTADDYHGNITDCVCDVTKGRPPGLSQPYTPSVQHPALRNLDLGGMHDRSNPSCRPDAGCRGQHVCNAGILPDSRYRCIQDSFRLPAVSPHCPCYWCSFVHRADWFSHHQFMDYRLYRPCDRDRILRYTPTGYQAIRRQKLTHITAELPVAAPTASLLKLFTFNCPQ